MSRSFTFSAASSTPTADANIKRATNATGRSGRYANATSYRKTTSARNSTIAWRKKCTSAAPMEAIGRISRGKATLRTSPALATTELVAPDRPTENRFQTRSPDSRKIGKFGMPLPRMSWKTT